MSNVEGGSVRITKYYEYDFQSESNIKLSLNALGGKPGGFFRHT